MAKKVTTVEETPVEEIPVEEIPVEETIPEVDKDLKASTAGYPSRDFRA